MQVLSVRCGLTKNLGNYESAKLEVEAAPSDGQTASDLLAEVKGYMEQQIAATTGGNGKTSSKPSAKPPLASGKPAPRTDGKAVDKAVTTGEPGDSGPPFDDGKPVKENKPKPARKKAAKKPAAKKTKADAQANMGKPAHEKELQYTLDSETLEELLERFNVLRDEGNSFRECFGVDGYEAAVSKIANRYRDLQSTTSDEKTSKMICAGFKAERNFIDDQRSTSEAA